MAHPRTPLRVATARSAFRAWIAGFGAGLSTKAEQALDHRSRAGQSAACRGMTDADLAQLGIARDGIVAHIFRDKLHL